MTSGNSTEAASVNQAGFDMPGGEMAAPPGPSMDMPSGEMPGEELSAFTPATGEMPRGAMGEPAGGALAGVTAGLEAAALSDMPGGDMGRIEAEGAIQDSAIEISGTWTLQLTSSIFKTGTSR
jgi:hypothetical protein